MLNLAACEWVVEIVKALILGIVQGATEFLPISSSGHLVIGGQILDFHNQGILFEVFLHLGTLLSVCVAFKREILLMIRAPFAAFFGKMTAELKEYLWWDLYVVIATLPAVVVGLFFKEQIELAFQSVLVVYVMLLFTGVMMILTSRLKERGATIDGKNALLIGCAQALAILPGLSRSGTTIFAGMLIGIERQKVARFSFIMSIPAIIGAVVLQTKDMLGQPPELTSIYEIAVGTFAAAITGYFAIILLMDLLKKNRLPLFGYYCLAVSFIGFTHYFLV